MMNLRNILLPRAQAEREEARGPLKEELNLALLSLKTCQT